MTIALLIAGLFIGAWAGSRDGEIAGALLGATLAWAITRLRSLAGRVEALEKRAMPALAPKAVSGVEPEPATGADAALPMPSMPAAAPTLAAPTHTVPTLTAIGEALALTPAPAPALTPAPAPEPPPARAVRASPPTAALPPALHNLVFGGNTIVKLGVAILFVGLAFLARFAAEHVHIAMPWRLAGIGLVAVVLLVIGWRLRERRRGYALVLQGGAVAVLYLTLFAAFRFYGLLALGPTFALMVAVAALSAALAVLQEAPALAFTGALGGFAAPILLSTGGGQHVPLFGYYLVLDLGIAGVAWWRHWRALNALAFACTYGVAAAWGVRSFRPEHALSCEIFLVLYFMLFAAVTLLPARHAAKGAGGPGAASAGGGAAAAPAAEAAAPAAGAAAAERWINAGLLFGLPTVTMALQYGIWRGDEAWMALTALALGAFYVGLAARARRSAALSPLFQPTLAIGAVLAILVVPFGFDARVTSGAWALEGAGLVWAGLRQRHGLTRITGYALLLFSGVAAGVAHADAAAPAAAFNAVLVNAVLVAAGALAAAWFVQRAALPLKEPETAAEPVLIGWGTLWLLGAIGFEVGHYVSRDFEPAALLALVAGLAALYLLLAKRLAWAGIAWPLALHAPWLAPALAFGVATHGAPLQHGGWWAWPLALGAQLAVLRWATPAWPMAVRRLTHALGPLIIAGLGAFEGRRLTADWGDSAGAWPWLGWLAAPAIVLGLLLGAQRRSRSGTARWPFAADAMAYFTIAGGVLGASLLAWALIANGASSGAAAPLPHVPLLNPLDLGIGIALVAAWAWWRSGAAPEAWVQHHQAVAWGVLGAGAFLWLNGMLIRAFHHHGGVPYHVHAWAESLAVQTGLTLLWSALALALMWAAARRAQRAVWITGAALLGVVVLKLLLVDLSGTGTVTRIVSFIGVGVLMLIIGYVAPLPARPQEETPRAAR